MFTHPDAPEHQGADFSSLDRALRLLGRAPHFPAYWPLALQYVARPQRARTPKFAAFFQHVFARPWGEADARELGFYVGSQSIVRAQGSNGRVVFKTER